MKIKRADIERILILCAAALVVVLALRSGGQTTSQVLVETAEVPVEQTNASTKGDTISAVVYYEDGDGYLVPVTRQVEKTDGIAKATLNLMVKSSENDMQAARLGLRTVIPEGTTFDIDIANGRANVNMSKEALSCSGAEQENLMVNAVAGALSCFSTVDEVTFEFDGKKRSKLTYGTDVSGVFSGDELNLESVETFSKDANLVKLYFPSQTGRFQQCGREHSPSGAGQGPQKRQRSGTRPAGGLRHQERRHEGRSRDGELFQGVQAGHGRDGRRQAGRPGDSIHLLPVPRSEKSGSAGRRREARPS